MALYTNYSLFVDVENGVVSRSFQDVNPLNDPAFFNGDHSLINVYFVKPNNVSAAPYEEVVISGLASVNVAIGTSTAVATSTSGLTALSAATASFSTIVAYSAGVNQIDRITIGPEPKGGTFSVQYNSVPIGSISVNASASDLQTFLISGIGATTGSITVTKVGNFAWDIEWDEAYFPPHAAVVLGSAAIISFVGYEIVLDLTVAGVATLLGSASSAAATLEISTTQMGTSYVQTAAQIPCTVFEQIL